VLVEKKFGQFENIASYGESVTSIFIVTRGHFNESHHRSAEEWKQESDVPKLNCREGSICRL
jgi:hypothetical protein